MVRSWQSSTDTGCCSVYVQVAAACQRVALLRATVPNQLAQQLTEHLQQCRPASDTPEKDQHALLDIDAHTVSTALADHSAAEAAASPTRSAARDSQRLVPGLHTDAIIMTPLSPAPADLQNMYTAAVQRMPALRYRLFVIQVSICTSIDATCLRYNFIIIL